MKSHEKKNEYHKSASQFHDKISKYKHEIKNNYGILTNTQYLHLVMIHLLDKEEFVYARLTHILISTVETRIR